MENLSEDWKKHMPMEEVSNMSWVWNNGMSLGKKVLITGILIFSAPLILPPLFVISAFCLALSVPFGVFFTSYACTEKLMSKLLSTPTLPPLLHDDNNDGYDEIRSDVKEETGFGETVDFDDEESVICESKDENVGKFEEKIAPVIEAKEINTTSRNEKMIVMEVEKLDTDAKDENIEKSNVGTTKIIGKPSGSKKKKSTQKTTGGAINKDSKGLEQNVNGKHLEKKAMPKGGTDESNVDKSDEHRSHSVVDTKEGAEQPPSLMGVKSAPTVDHPASMSEVPKSPSGKGSTRRSDKVIYSEAELWENIGVLRTIVGYNGAPQATVMEELKAIYIFTGVEPPCSFKDQSTLAEIDDKLRFLMSIVGVK